MHVININDEILKYPKPDDLFIKEFQWKLLVINFLKKKNTLLIGLSGTGKTISIKTLVEVLNQSDSFYYFNLGASQDPRSVFIGNTHFDSNTGTFFDESDFIKAIKKENSIILLDEIFGSGGDREFENKATIKMEKLIKGGATVIIASHDLDIIKKYCDKVLWLDRGRIIKFGKSDDIIKSYIRDS